jgi:TPR repeat protein
VPEAQYALGTLYKEGRGVDVNEGEAVRLMQRAAAAGNLDAMIEFAIAQYNGAGVTKDEKAGATLMLKAAQRGSPIAQNRVAKILSTGRGLPANSIEAMKWHIIAKKDGRGDPELDAFMAKQKQEDRTKAEVAATRWLASARPNP